MFAKLMFKPEAVNTLYGSVPVVNVNLHSQDMFDLESAKTGEEKVVEVSPLDTEILNNMMGKIPGFSFELYEDESCTTSGDWGSVFCDGTGRGTQEFLKCLAADINKVISSSTGIAILEPGSTCITMDTGKLYCMGADYAWHLMS